MCFGEKPWGGAVYSRAILTGEAVAIVGVLDEGHVHPHQRGTVCGQHLTPDQGRETGRGRQERAFLLMNVHLIRPHKTLKNKPLLMESILGLRRDLYD